ncbi:zinc finger protein 414 [Pelodytes ibericus]
MICKIWDQQEAPSTEVQPEDGVPPAAKTRVESKKEREGGRKRSLHPSKRGHKCSAYGCNRTFLKMQELISHVSVHYKPTESLNGKQFLCSVSACGQALDSMQDLMSHLKVHYKPNRYFKCENCMQHFRTHRSLFKHLHVCIDNSLNPTTMNVQPPPPSVDSNTPALTLEPMKQHQSVIRCIKKETQAPVSAVELPATSSMAPLSQFSDDLRPSMSSVVSNPFAHLDPSLFGGQFPGPTQSSVAGSYLPFLHPSAYNIPGSSSVPQRLRTYLGSQSPPVSNAVWKKNQGHSTNSRILWEHTRDSYNCMQCSFSATSRDQMTKHIEELHKNPPNRLQAEMGYDLDLLLAQ